MKYYYLISSLPDLQINDSSISKEQLDEYLELIARNLSEEDQRVFECLLHSSDNQNLLYILFKEYHDFEMHGMIEPGAISLETLENYRRSYAALPDYMSSYLKDFSASFSAFSPREMERHLHTYFYAHQADLQSEFLNTYSLWRFRLKRAVADANRKLYPFFHTRSETEEPFFSPTQPLHGLPAFEEIVSTLLPFLETNNLEAIERKVDAYYFAFADSWTVPFSAEQVFAYTLKIIRIHRWKTIVSKGEMAQSSFEQSIEDLKKREPSPKMPFI